MKFRIFFFLSFFLLFISNFKAQEYPQDYFRSPLDVPLYLSGNFGELRNNHFHAGIDIKTTQQEGLKVYAAADGYVSRIKVSPYGYGSAIYVRHPNGYTTTYAHLSKYANKIEEYVKKAQYERESFAIELFPSASDFPVLKGDVIAYTGNSGGSAGPHLHFEIRNTSNEHPLNPLFFGFDIKDNIPPIIQSIHFYPLNDTSTINGNNSILRVNASGSNGSYSLNSKVEVDGQIGIGIRGVDKMNYTSNTYGFYSVELLLDSQKIYRSQMDEFAFHEGRYINSHIDYDYKSTHGRRVEKCYIDDGNKLRIYKELKDEGKITISDEKEYKVLFLVSDAYGNTSRIEFDMQGKAEKFDAKQEEKISSTDKEMTFFEWDKRNTLMKDNILVDLPPNILYEDIYFEFEEGDSMKGALSPTYWLHDYKVPLHRHYTLSIKVNGLSDEEKKKSLIVSTLNGYSKYAEGGKWNGDNISVRTRSFGGFAVVQDNDAPIVRPVNIYNGANMSKKWSIYLKAYDTLSGINYYRGTVDGKWVLMEYDAKNNSFIYYFDDRIEKGKHIFHFTVSDGVGNTTQYSAEFYR